MILRAEDELDAIELRASRWLAARDGGELPADEAREFEAWLEADIRHRVAYLRLEGTWQRAEKLRDLRPLDRSVDPDLLREHPERGPWRMAAAAALLLATAGGGWWYLENIHGWQHYETRIGGFARVVLDDGSVVDLNTDSEVRVRLGDDARELELTRGEGRFQVAHDAARPFTVDAADARVRAVGTAFSVRLRESAQVDVLVSEGRVAIASTRVRSAPPVSAGEAAVVLPDRLSVSRVEPQALERRLAWTRGRLSFRGETLADAVAEFNRYNLRKLRLGDAGLAGLRVGGSFEATDPESFAAALARAFDLKAEPHADAIVLRPP